MTRVPVALLGFCALACGCRQGESNAAPSPAGPAGPVGSAGPVRPTQGPGELATALATIDDVTITLGELQERINRQSPYVRQRYTSLEQKKEFLDSMIRFEILAKEAARRGLDKDPEVVRTMKQVMIQKLMRLELDAKITADSVPEAEIRSYFQTNLKDFVKPEEIRVSAIILKNKAQADRVALEARGDEGKTYKGFRDLVMKYSTDEDTKLRGGDLRFFSAASKDLPAPVVKAAFGLVNTGDVSNAIDAGNGTFYVLKQTGRRQTNRELDELKRQLDDKQLPAAQRPGIQLRIDQLLEQLYEDAKPQIRNRLFRERRLAAQKKFVEASRARAKIQVNEASLAKVFVDTSSAPGDEGHDPMPPPMPGGPPSPEAAPAAAAGAAGNP